MIDWIKNVIARIQVNARAAWPEYVVIGVGSFMAGAILF